MKKLSKLAIILSVIFIANSEVKPQAWCQNFTSSTFPPTGWTIEFSGTQYWTRNAVSGYGQGSGSAKFDFYTATQGTVQSMITSTLTPTVAGDSLRFDHAYASYQGEVDVLTIYTSIDAGTTYTTLIVLPGGPVVGQGMVTAPPQLTPFTPTSSQWASKNYLVPPGTNKIKFEATSAYGNNLYLDNICVVSLTGITPLTDIPKTYSLLQNYPNPFNPTTVISYSLPKAGNVTLKLYDVLGNETVVLVDGFQQAGYHNVSFDASRFSSGLYFYRITSGEFTDIKKMMLIK
jgi:hypothetical protein